MSNLNIFIVEVQKNIFNVEVGENKIIMHKNVSLDVANEWANNFKINSGKNVVEIILNKLS